MLCSAAQAETLLSEAKRLGQSGLGQLIEACPLHRQAADPGGACSFSRKPQPLALTYRAAAAQGDRLATPFGQNTSFAQNTSLGQNRLFGKP